MHCRKNTAFLPAFTLLAGVVGLVIRIWQINGGVDKKGLFVPFHPSSVLLLLLCVAVVAVLAVCTWGKRPGSRICSGLNTAGAAIGGIGMLIISFFGLSRAGLPLSVLTSVLAVLAAACSVYIAVRCEKRKALPVFCFCAAPLFFALLLICQYRTWSSEPQVMKYLFSLIAFVLLLLTGYFGAVADTDSGKAMPLLFTQSAAAFFCTVAIPGQGVPRLLFFLCMSIRLYIAIFAGRRACAAGSDAMSLPREVRFCMQSLTRAGYQAYAVGGCVRDSLLGLTPHDYDLCTDALPEQICQVFANRRLVRSGEKHGTIGVVLGGSIYEITTFRKEGAYSDHRRPDQVSFTAGIKEDLARRDFTVNAIAFSPRSGIVDPFGGQKDLNARVLRTVGDPAARFEEDALRILRGVRFSVTYGLTPDEATEQGMFDCAKSMELLAKERIFDELCKLLPHMKAADILRYEPILTQVIPELKPCVQFDQRTPFHAYDVYTHIAHVVEACDKDLSLRWAGLLHDVGKPATFTTDETGRGHFYDHPRKSAELAAQILNRLRAPTALREEVVLLIRDHMLSMDADKPLLRRRVGKYGMDHCRKLLKLQRADNLSKGVPFDPAGLDAVDALLDEIAQEQACLTVRDLAVNGNDLLALGIPAGSQIGILMQSLLDLVQADVIPNTREALLSAAEKMKETK